VTEDKKIERPDISKESVKWGVYDPSQLPPETTFGKWLVAWANKNREEAEAKKRAEAKS
jgi:hypothetical protein